MNPYDLLSNNGYGLTLSVHTLCVILCLSEMSKKITRLARGAGRPQGMTSSGSRVANTTI